MWVEKRMSASQIAKAMGVSRNAIIGLIHRMGLDGFREATAEEIAAQKALRAQRNRDLEAARAAKRLKEAAAPKSVKVKAPVRETLQPVPMLNIPFSQRRATQCSWIAGEPGADATCCGLEVVDGKSWCAHHHAMVYEPRALRVVSSNPRPNRTTTRYGALRFAS